jgi:hypothetical protein
MKIYKAMISSPDYEKNNTSIFECDAIEFEGKFWLVPNWLEDGFGSVKTPKRIICLSKLDHSVSSLSYADFLVKVPIPKNVLDGRITEHDKETFLILEYPELSALPSGKS